MRFLKKKIQLKQQYLHQMEKLSEINIKMEASVSETAESEAKSPSSTQEFILPLKRPKQMITSEGNSKNIVKNYGKALCAFASSGIAIPYLEKMVVKQGYYAIKVTDFTAYIKAKKEKINSIDSLRKLLLVDINDNREVRAYKAMFQEISIIFLKFFAVNWIFSGKLIHKTAHLKYRFKMLHRVRDPENFTYLKTSPK